MIPPKFDFIIYYDNCAQLVTSFFKLFFWALHQPFFSAENTIFFYLQIGIDGGINTNNEYHRIVISNRKGLAKESDNRCLNLTGLPPRQMTV